ncbi:MAG: hypothetical protein QOD77_1699 [Thermoplasmata archaeon]|jgi:hypothetical protein|nr:hypothetical protein [Thermoplasmata archaeon]
MDWATPIYLLALGVVLWANPYSVARALGVTTRAVGRSVGVQTSSNFDAGAVRLGGFLLAVYGVIAMVIQV